MHLVARVFAVFVVLTFTLAGVTVLVLSRSHDAAKDATKAQQSVKQNKTKLAELPQKFATKNEVKIIRQDSVRTERILVQGKIAKNGANGLQGTGGPIGRTGPPGRPGRDAVIPFTLQDLADRLPPAIQGPEGAQGAPGRDATDQQALDALATYCSVHNDCKGDTGATGPAGADGVQGPPGADGAQGPAGG